jgi:uncharacterized ferredoxin-like protein
MKARPTALKRLLPTHKLEGTMDAIRMVADLMTVAARTAPKASGGDFVVTEIIQGHAMRRLAEKMIAYGEDTGKRNFDRDGDNVLKSQAVVLIGLKDAKTLGLNCGACGEPKCIKTNTYEGEFKGPQCAISTWASPSAQRSRWQ